MPELPEVETVCRGLAARLEGRRFSRVIQRRKDLRFPLPERFAERLTGRRVKGLGRRAKYILVHLDSGEVLAGYVGQGARVLLSTDQPTPGALFDTEIVVYCGPCDATGAGLACVAHNDDKSEATAQAELAFCARAGVEYFILIRGFGLAAANVGDFVLLTKQLTDTGGQPLTCCDPQPCGEPCTFTIPAGASFADMVALNRVMPRNCLMCMKFSA